MELIRVEDIRKTYHLGEIDVPVLNGVSFTIRRGELVALMGASGSGKTTLMNILGCLDRPSSGKYWLDGEELSELTPNERALVRTSKLGFVFQSFNLLPRTPAISNVLMPLDYSTAGLSHAEARQRALELLDRVGLSERLDHEPSQMSGGQQQRVAIARALINKPALVLADEPTGNLDSHTSVEILQMFQQLNAVGITVVLVTHDPKVASFASRVIRIADGLIESDGPAEPLLAGPHIGFHPHTDANGNGASSSSLPSALAAVDRSGHVHGYGNGDGNGVGNGDAELARHSLETVTAAAGQPLAARTSAKVATSTAPDALPATSPAGTLPVSPEVAMAQPAVASSAIEVSAETKRAGDSKVWAMLPPTFRTALGALRRNKMRAALTALGIVIGIGAVIVMTEIGQGVKEVNRRAIASLGANNLQVQSGAAASGGVTFGSGSILTLTPQDSEEIARQCPSVDSVAPAVRARATIIYGGRNWVPMNIWGTTPEYLTVRDWTDLDDGEMFTDRDVASASKVCVVGQTIVRELFDGQSPVGKSIRIQNVSLQVLGVLSKKGASMGGFDQDDVVMAPWTTVKYRISGNNAQTANQSAGAAAASGSATSNQVNTLNKLFPGSTALFPIPSATQQADTPQPVRFVNVDSLWVKAASSDQIPAAIDEITRLLRDRHHLRSDEENDFNIRDMTEMNKTLTATTDLISRLLIVVATVSLIVGGVGIMNIMLVSVVELTREIGLRMAVGARTYHILRQFLIEAVVLCLFGGIVGILAGRGFSLLVARFSQFTPLISYPAIIAAFVVSVTVGIVFGYYPAWKASRLDPIEALRYE